MRTAFWLRNPLGKMLIFSSLIVPSAGAQGEPSGPGPQGARSALTARAEETLRLQVLLDRAHFSPGEIDAAMGSNTRRALEAYRRAHQQPPAEDGRPIVGDYTLTAEDLVGPFRPVPEDMMEKAALPELGFASPLEGLAEKFHASPALLQRLNPGADFARAGTTVRVPDTGRAALPKVEAVEVDRSDSSVLVLGEGSALLARYPATLGSERDPLPMGEWKINGVGRSPTFHYNPDLFWDAEPAHAKATLASGPNNPVGLVWIDLSKEHYGIHGTAEPRTVGKTQSHGCIRLTNWDALELANAVAPGMPAVLHE
jgi:lipoprotein-anchoring transpeptidase ErfK/SrfK